MSRAGERAVERGAYRLGMTTTPICAVTPLALAYDGAQRARAALTAAHPAVWHGAGADAYESARQADLELVEALLVALEEALAAEAAYTDAAATVVAALGAGGGPFPPAPAFAPPAPAFSPRGLLPRPIFAPAPPPAFLAPPPTAALPIPGPPAPVPQPARSPEPGATGPIRTRPGGWEVF